MSLEPRAGEDTCGTPCSDADMAHGVTGHQDGGSSSVSCRALCMDALVLPWKCGAQTRNMQALGEGGCSSGMNGLHLLPRIQV